MGARANLVLLDLDATQAVTEDGFRSRSTNSWLLGETLRGAVVKTIADGRVVLRGMTAAATSHSRTAASSRGRRSRAAGVAFGEAVFTTAMTGYQETVTDPSFAGQLVAFTAPMVGNYGVDDRRLESSHPWAKAVLMRRCGGNEWALWLASHGIVALEEVDTRTARAPAAGGGGDARRRRRLAGRPRPRGGARADPGAAVDGGPGARLRRLLGRADGLQRRRARPGGGRRLRRQGVDHAEAAAGPARR